MINRIFLLMALAVFCLSCSKEEGRGTTATEREVEMNFLLPGVSTRAAGDGENAINNLTILVFDGSGNDAVYLYSRYAWRKSGTANTYTTTMKIGSGFTIYFAANRDTLAGDLEDKGITEEISTWADVRDALVMNDPGGDMLAGGLPMWGRVTGKDITDQANNHLGTIQLIRSVASIDIYMLAPDFQLTEGHTVFAADKGYMPYDPEKMREVNQLLRAHTPYSPYGFATSVDLSYTLQPDDNGEIVGKFYVYENATPLTGATGTNRPTKVILRGIWDNSAAGATYYPLSLRTRLGDGSYVKKQVMRNNKYIIMVLNVHGDGYPGIDEAKNADDVNWDYDVIEWDDNEDGEIIIEGTKYFYRDRSSVTLPRYAGSSTRVNIRTNYDLDDIKMKFLTGHDINSHPRFNVELVKKEDSQGSAYDFLLITAKADYGTTDNPAILNLSVGRISLNIHMEQLDMSKDDWENGGNIGVIVE